MIDLTGGKNKAAAYRESVRRGESSSRESDATPDEQMPIRDRSSKSDLERHLLAKRAARGDAPLFNHPSDLRAHFTAGEGDHAARAASHADGSSPSLVK